MGIFLDYYELLEIQDNASNIEIKKVYREKAKVFHPDLNNNINAEETMKELNEAKVILLDPIKRKAYDIIWKNHYKDNIIVESVPTVYGMEYDYDNLQNICIVIVKIACILAGLCSIYYMIQGYKNAGINVAILIFILFVIAIYFVAQFLFFILYGLSSLVISIYIDLVNKFKYKDSVKEDSFLLVKLFALVGFIFGGITGYIKSEEFKILASLVQGLAYSFGFFIGCIILNESIIQPIKKYLDNHKHIN